VLPSPVAGESSQNTFAAVCFSCMHAEEYMPFSTLTKLIHQMLRAAASKLARGCNTRVYGNLMILLYFVNIDRHRHRACHCLRVNQRAVPHPNDAQRPLSNVQQAHKRRSGHAQATADI
jgi:hypothetical protein